MHYGNGTFIVSERHVARTNDASIVLYEGEHLENASRIKRTAKELPRARLLGAKGSQGEEAL